MNWYLGHIIKICDFSDSFCDKRFCYMIAMQVQVIIPISMRIILIASSINSKFYSPCKCGWLLFSLFKFVFAFCGHICNSGYAGYGNSSLCAGGVQGVSTWERLPQSLQLLFLFAGKNTGAGKNC